MGFFLDAASGFGRGLQMMVSFVHRRADKPNRLSRSKISAGSIHVGISENR